MRVWAVISAPILVSKGVGVSKSTGFGYYLLQTTGRIQRGYGGRGGVETKNVDTFLHYFMGCYLFISNNVYGCERREKSEDIFRRYIEDRSRIWIK